MNETNPYESPQESHGGDVLRHNARMKLYLILLIACMLPVSFLGSLLIAETARVIHDFASGYLQRGGRNPEQLDRFYNAIVLRSALLLLGCFLYAIVKVSRNFKSYHDESPHNNSSVRLDPYQWIRDRAQLLPIWARTAGSHLIVLALFLLFIPITFITWVVCGTVMDMTLQIYGERNLTFISVVSLFVSLFPAFWIARGMWRIMKLCNVNITLSKIHEILQLKINLFKIKHSGLSKTDNSETKEPHDAD